MRSGVGLFDASSLGKEGRHLVGKIAFDSFQRVRRQFYELVLKADVGLIVVAFTRKQTMTQQIQALSGQKDRELQALDESFRDLVEERR